MRTPMQILGSIFGGGFLFVTLLTLMDSENSTLKVAIFFSVIILGIIAYYLYDNRNKKQIIENSSDGSIEIFENGNDYSNQKKQPLNVLRVVLFVVFTFVILWVLIIGSIALLMGH